MKNIRLGIGILFLIVAVKNQSLAQTQFLQDVNGKPMFEKKYQDVKGSPYLFEKWLPGTVQLDNGQTYKTELKYDLLSDEITFKNNKGDSLYFVQPVKQFNLEYVPGLKNATHVFKNGFPSTGGKTNEQTFYEVLFDGNIKLLKKQTKWLMVEQAAFGSATQTQSISEKINYFTYKQDKIQPFKTEKKAVLAILNDKATEIEQYIKDNKLNLKNDEDLVKIFSYYSTL